MIFEPTLLDDKKYRNQFNELISIYISIIERIAEKYNFIIDDISDYTDDMITEMISIGVINDRKNIKKFEEIIGKETALKFRSCISFRIKHQKEIGGELDKLSNQKRRDLQQKESESHKPTFIDFFAGAGGLSCGFTKAGYRVVFANDFEEVCIQTYKYNHPEMPSKNIVEGDIRNIVKNINEYISGPVDVVVGGPPCQGFSSANKQRIIDDPRNELYKYYIEAIKKILPKFVVMENVQGMLSVAHQVVEDFESISEIRDGKSFTYKVEYRLLNSADFSVAQARVRLIYIAIRNDICKNQNISSSDIFNEIAKLNKGKEQYVLRDALEYIAQIQAPRIKNQNEVDSDITGRKVAVNVYSGNENSYLRLINNNRTIPLTFNHKARYLNDINYEIYRLLEPGDDASDQKIVNIMPYKHRLHCFKDKYFKLIPDKPSRTITAHLRMDCHSHIHPFQIRALTPREAARCQSFPDDYLFLGPYLKTYMQIGNAVPVLMAEGIAKAIKKYLL